MSDTLNASDVRNFLKENPDFFITHSDTLTWLNLPDTVDGNMVSFNDFQTRKLKQKIAKLEDKITILMRTALQNEQSTHGLNTLASEILNCATKEAVVDLVTAKLQTDFTLDSVIFNPDAAANEAQVTLRQIANEKHQVRSEAVLNLGDSGHHFGTLTLGSHDETRFYEGQGVELLTFLSEIVSHQLARTCQNDGTNNRASNLPANNQQQAGTHA